MVRKLKIIHRLFILLILFVNSCNIYGPDEGFLKRNSHVIHLVMAAAGTFGPFAYQIWKRDPEAEELQMEAQRLLNDKITLNNKKLKQEVDFNNDSTVQENKRKLFAANTVLQNIPKWIRQELQIRSQAIEAQNRDGRVGLLQEINLIGELKKNEPEGEEKKKLDLIRLGLLERLKDLVNGGTNITMQQGNEN